MDAGSAVCGIERLAGVLGRQPLAVTALGLALGDLCPVRWPGRIQRDDAWLTGQHTDRALKRPGRRIGYFRDRGIDRAGDSFVMVPAG